MTLRLTITALLACALLPVTARADNLIGEASSTLPGVTIEIPQTTDRSPDGWDTPPLIAQIIPDGPGVILYRFGAGPGTWQRCLGPVVIPPGKQTMSAVLISPSGVPGPIQTITARSDIHAEPLSGTAALAVSAEASTYTGTPSVAGGVTVSVIVGRQLGTLVRRLGGSDRYATGAVLSASTPPASKTVIIATGQKFPDALTASGLAGCLSAPVLLTGRTSLPSATRTEIRRRGARRAIICGGTPSVANSVAKQLRGMGLSVTRLGGKNRFETAVAISKRIQKLTHSHSRVFIARADVFYDALIVAPLAYTTHAPILLTTPRKLYPTTRKRLASARYGYATIIGGALSSSAERTVRSRVRVLDRWSGSNQYDTSVQVAATSIDSGALSWKYVGLARGDIFPDALCGGVLAGKQGGVILLTPPSSLDPGVANALTAHAGDVRRCEIYGSPAAISDNVLNQVKAIFH